MRYAWSAADGVRFAGDPQRARYLKTNAIMVPPPAETPLYAIQYVGYSSCPTYTTPANSLIVFASDSAYFLGTTEEFETTIGRWDKAHHAHGPEPEARLNQPACLWNPLVANANTELAKLQAFKLTTPEALYDKIIRLCDPLTGSVQATFTARELRDIVPNAPAPESGTALGEADEMVAPEA